MKKFFILLLPLAFLCCTNDSESDTLDEIESRFETLDTEMPAEHDRMSDLYLTS